MDNTPEVPDEGLSRRDIIRRSAIVGGAAIWATPIITTLATPAAAQTEVGEPPPGTALSEVTLLLNCGGTYFWAKYNPQSGSGAPTECKGDINVAESNTDATCTAAEAAIDAFLVGKTVATSGCKTGSVSSTGVLCINYSGCTVVGWTIHDGFAGAPNHCAYMLNGVEVSNNNGTAYEVTDNGTSICFAKTV